VAVKKKASKKKAKQTAKKKSAKKSGGSKSRTAPKKASKKKVTTKKKTAKKKVANKKAVKKKATPKKAPAKKKAKKSVPKAKAKKAAPKTTKSQTTKAKAPAKKSAAKSKPGKIDPQIGKIKETLILERNKLLKMIRSSQEVERNVGDITFSNEIDLASSLEGREMAFQLSSRERNELRLIEDALVRITKGTYGVCESCSKKIGVKRLQIMPLTPLCIECQSNLEVN